MKVIICSPLLSYPGHFLRMAKERALSMASAGIDVTIVGFRESFGKDFSENKLSYMSVEASLRQSLRKRTEKLSRRFGKPWIVIVENFRATLFAVKYVRAQKADIIYISDLEPWVIFLLALCGFVRRNSSIAAFYPYPYFEKSTAFSLPFFSFCRAFLNYLLTPLIPRWIHVICDNPFVVSKNFKNESSKIHIVPEGFSFTSVSKEQKEAARRELGIPQNIRALLFFGAAAQNKGAQYLYEALASLEPDFMLLIVGTIVSLFQPLDASRKPDMERWSNRIIRLPGFVSEKVRELSFMACDAVVLPHQKEWYTASGCLRDGINYGKAIITSDQYLEGQLVGNYNLGLMFPPEDIDGLRSCLREFARKPDEWFREIELRGKQVALEYSWENIGGIYKRTFEKIMND